ncbi:hypothetical protein MCOR25_008820 [Pyricularia grisea]|nr:hypothetical protein MCOR25_008820 [Pyricularia grisea]
MLRPRCTHYEHYRLYTLGLFLHQAPHFNRSNAARRARHPHPGRSPTPFPIPEYQPPIPIIKPPQNPNDGSKFILEATKTPLTLRHLLAHTSGLAYDATSDELHPAWRDTLPSSNPRATSNLIFPNPMDIRMQFHTPLVFSPGEAGKWCYGSGLDWAGRVIERANGEALSLGAYMEKYIFAPLGMRSATFRPTDKDRLIHRDDRDAETGAVVPGSTEGFAHVDVVDECGGSGLYVTAQDYAGVLEALLRDDGVLLSSEATGELFRPQLADAEHPDVQAKLAEGQDVKAMLMDGGDRARVTWNHGLGGLVALDNVPGKFRGGVMAASGMINSFWVSFEYFLAAEVAFRFLSSGLYNRSVSSTENGRRFWLALVAGLGGTLLWAPNLNPS